MHWFWRAAIAAVAGTALSQCYFAPTYTAGSSVIESGHAWLAETVYKLLGGPTVFGQSWQWQTAHAVSYQLPTVLIAVVLYGLLTRFLPGRSRAAADRETRCRECGYILRGITEPRCPECGERI